jgi:NADPH-dependent 2,4-dienoyl-CoA reductase/sulfur reductase-like enzyme
MGEKVIVVGGVAAGTKAASRAKRLNPGLDITIYTAEADISYAGCGLPYFVGDTIKSREELVVRSPREFEEQQGIKVVVKTVVEALEPCSKTLCIRNVETGEISRVNYDKLILATGSVPIMPKLPSTGLQGFYQLRSVPDAEALKAKVKSGAKRAVVIGGGVIGLEKIGRAHV